VSLLQEEPRDQRSHKVGQTVIERHAQLPPSDVHQEPFVTATQHRRRPPVIVTGRSQQPAIPHANGPVAQVAVRGRHRRLFENGCQTRSELQRDPVRRDKTRTGKNSVQV